MTLWPHYTATTVAQQARQCLLRDPPDQELRDVLRGRAPRSPAEDAGPSQALAPSTMMIELGVVWGRHGLLHGDRRHYLQLGGARVANTICRDELRAHTHSDVL